MSKQNKTFLIIAIILIAAGLVLMVRQVKAPNGRGQIVKPINQADHVIGPLTAPVQLIIYSDFQCPFCAQFVEPIKKVAENFKDQVAITFRHYPLPGHPEAEKAAQASECAALQAKFWQMHDKLFADNVAGGMSSEQYKIDAADLALDTTQFNQCLDSGQYAKKISEQKAEGKKAGVTGTPTFFVNGKIYPGAYPFEDFTAPDGRPEKGLKSIVGELLK